MDVNTVSLFGGSMSDERLKLDIESPKSQNAITTLPNNFQIMSMVDIAVLREYLATTFCGYTILYRGHESTEYKIESTIVRLLKGKGYSSHELAKAERIGYDLFCQKIFNDAWLKNKAKDVDAGLFKMSIGRHLGLPCRLIDFTASLETAIWFAVMNPNFLNKDGDLVIVILDKNEIAKTKSPFKTNGMAYAHEPFLTDSLDGLPLGEQRRFIQNGHFIWVDDNSLLDEQRIVLNHANTVIHFLIPSFAKTALSARLYRDVYSGCACQAEIEKIKKFILK